MDQPSTAHADLDALIARLRSFGEAYPEDMFGPVTEQEIKEHASLITRNSAAMGRHCAKFMLEAAAALAALRADAGAMEVLRELVRLKGIKENLEVYETGSAAERIEWARDYNKNKPLAWDRARTLLDAAREAEP